MIISLSGRANSVKDTIGKIIQYFTWMKEHKLQDSDLNKRQTCIYYLNNNFVEGWGDIGENNSHCRFPNEIKAVKAREGVCIKIVRDILDNSNLVKEATEKAHELLITRYGEHTWREDGEGGYKYQDFYQTKFNEFYDRFYEELQPKLHESETSLDDFEDWDFVIKNNGSLEELVENVKQILIKLELL